MDSEDKKLLQETLTLARENNKMLHKVRNVQKWATFWQILKWLVIIILTIGSFYYIEPYLSKMLDLYNSISGTEQKLTGGVNSFQDLLKNIDLNSLKNLQK